AVLLVVGVHGDVVDQVVGVRQDGAFPLAEGGHLHGARPADHQRDRRVDELHGLAGLGGELAVLVGVLVTDLPRAVHLVAQAPQRHAVGLAPAVGDAQIGPAGAGVAVAVLHERGGGLDAARA